MVETMKYTMLWGFFVVVCPFFTFILYYFINVFRVFPHNFIIGFYTFSSSIL